MITDIMDLLQVEQQFSHKFTVNVVSAENVTKGALGDLCKLFCHCCVFVGLYLWLSKEYKSPLRCGFKIKLTFLQFLQFLQLPIT